MPIFTTLGAACAKAWGFTSGLITDQYFNLVSLLLPGNGTNGAQNNTFLDSSTNNFTITRNGNTTQGTFSPFSQTGWGNYFTGSGQRLNIANNTAFDFAAGNFTIEFWWYPTTVSSSQNIIAKWWTGGNQWVLQWRSAGYFRFAYNSSNTIDFTGAPSTPTVNTWNHIALVRNGNSLYLYLNGTRNATVGSISATLTATTDPLTIGEFNNSGVEYIIGYLSNVRITKGRAVYTSSSITVPTTPLTRTTGGENPPQGTECSLLTCQSNSFLDSNGVNIPASSPLTITVTGSPSVQAFSPFNPTAQYIPSINGGSGYFDGSGDYLTTPSNSAFAFGTGNFTVEAWIYIVQTNSANTFLLTTAGVSSDFSFYLSSSRQLTVWNGSANTTLGGSVPLNSWNHIAFVRNGTTITGYLNGTSVGSTTDGTNLINSQTVSIGASSTYPNSQTVYYSGLRVVKGTAVYTAAFTPPTAPLTAITNTSLLLNYTNAGIYDATSKNDLETAGNAQISTAQSKWGGGSISFDGTGDYLNAASSAAFTFGTGSFTIEGWHYLTASATSTKYLFDQRVSGQGFFPALYISSGSYNVYINSTIPINAGTVVANTWVHWALVKNSGTSTTTLYINGTSVGSFSDSNNYSSTAQFRIGSEFTTAALYDWQGYMQDVRITKGYARYTSNFTPPTAAFPTL
jgi:hypothetical protein